MSDFYTVIDIISPYQIVLNCGAENGIKSDSEFFVYGVGDLLKDPETKEDLEVLEIPRGTGRVSHLQKKICTIKSQNYRILSHSSFFQLNLDRKTESLPFDSPQIGDRAKLLK
ncbi:MAG: hypothetical protein AB1454_05330 [Candidatus Auribacterota bacterium]